MIGLQIILGSIKGLKEVTDFLRTPIKDCNYLLQNIGVKITNKVKISNLPSNIAKAKIPLLAELILA